LDLTVDPGDLKHQASFYHNFLMTASRNLAQPLNPAWLPAKRTGAAGGQIPSLPL
jgi:hypothetical protein